MSYLSDKQKAFALFNSYLAELYEINGYLPGCGTFRDRFESVWEAEDSMWYFLYHKDEMVGFLIIGTGENCHPDADFYIEEAYILPTYRNQGLMRDFIQPFILKNKGIYCMFILKNHNKAISYWKHIFKEVGYQPYELPLIGDWDDNVIQYGWKKIK